MRTKDREKERKISARRRESEKEKKLEGRRRSHWQWVGIIGRAR